MVVAIAGMVAACSAPLGVGRGGFGCTGAGPVATDLSGEAAMGYGSDGPITDVDARVTAVVRPGQARCPDPEPESQF